MATGDLTDKVFVKQGNILDQKLDHGEKNCLQCNKLFERKDSLETHMMIHGKKKAAHMCTM